MTSARRSFYIILIVLPGWALTLLYLYYDYKEHGGANLYEHLFSYAELYSFLFHVLILSVPLASTFFGYLANERLKLLDNLSAMQGRYKDYYDNAPYGYHSATDDLVIREVNETWLRMLGYERADVVDRVSINDLLTDESRRWLAHVYPAFRKSGRLVDEELDFIRKDGIKLPVLLSSTAIYGPKGEFIRSRTIIKDNSERKTYETILKAVALEWERTFNAMPWGVMIVDSNLNVLRYNDYVRQLQGLTPDEVAKAHCSKLIASGFKEAGNGSQSSGDMIEIFDEQNAKAYRLAGSPISESDIVKSYIFTIVDVTDIRLGERKLLDSRNAFFNMLKDVTVTYRELEDLHNSLIYAFANAIDAKSPWTKGHSERVTRYAQALAVALDLDQKAQDKLTTAALLHDIGKIGTYDYLLNKPEGLTSDEYEQVKKHPEKSALILAPIGRFSDIVDIVKYHHEQFDGRGYPLGLKGEDIPMMARILCIADSYDSMTADRPYRKAPGKEYAIKELRECAGSHFDPDLIEVFISLIEKDRV